MVMNIVLRWLMRCILIQIAKSLQVHQSLQTWETNVKLWKMRLLKEAMLLVITVSLLDNQRIHSVAASRRWGFSLSFTFYLYGCPISMSSRGCRSLLGFSVRYNGVIRNKTEKTKETAGTRVGFWLGPATCWCYRKAYARIRDHGTRGQVYTKKI